ncbi:MAG: polyprenyl synthetase family protein [Selenomonadaceae bacterium]|nr:polyprenyl synthetase family protein [Selenomonadaceae bacterium]
MLSESYSPIKKELDAVEVCLQNVSNTPLPMLSDIGSRLIGAGGKRLRPALFLLSARLSGKDNYDDLVPLAAALEITHVASLIHDDVIDNSGLRRGKETANARFGNHVAVLAGDYLFASVFGLIGDKEYPREVGLKLADLVKLLTVGEIQQDSSLYKIPEDADEYYRQIERKTAEFMAVCCETGAMVEGVGPKMARQMHDFGYNLGMAFQITDDLLDITGTDASIGKPAGSDIRQGVITLPVIYALNNSSDREKLTAIVSNPEMSESELAEAITIVRESGGVDFSRKKVQEFIRQAKASIPEECDSELRKSFESLADYILRRNF